MPKPPKVTINFREFYSETNSGMQRLHRVDGPAMEWWDGNVKEWHVNGEFKKVIEYDAATTEN